MSAEIIKHDTVVDLNEAEQNGRKSDISLLVISLLYIINITVSIIFVWQSSYTQKNIWINIGVLLENIFMMAFVIVSFNKHKH